MIEVKGSLDEILSSIPDDVMVFTLYNRARQSEDRDWLIFARDCWLGKFNDSGLSMAGERLSNQWGYDTAKIGVTDGRAWFEAPGNQSIKPWRCHVVYTAPNKAEIEAALKHTTNPTLLLHVWR